MSTGQHGRGRVAVEYEPVQDFAAIVTLRGAHDGATVAALNESMSSIDGDDLELVAAPANVEIGQALERIHIHDVVAVRDAVPEPVE